MTILVKEGDRANTPYKQYIIDTDAEVSDCEAKLGNIALSLESSTLFVCDGSGSWVEFK